MTGPHDSLPPGRVRRGNYLLTGRIDPGQAHPIELAVATRHILTHPNLEADAWRRPREDQALAELRASLGDAPWRHFGSAALLAVATGIRFGGECLRCRANLTARVHNLAAPYRDEATNYLIGEGCERCARRRPRTSSRGPAPGSTRPHTTTPAGARSTRIRPRLDVQALVAAVPPGAGRGVWARVLEAVTRGARAEEGLPPPPPISADPVHPSFRS